MVLPLVGLLLLACCAQCEVVKRQAFNFASFFPGFQFPPGFPGSLGYMDGPCLMPAPQPVTTNPATIPPSAPTATTPSPRSSMQPMNYIEPMYRIEPMNMLPFDTLPFNMPNPGNSVATNPQNPSMPKVANTQPSQGLFNVFQYPSANVQHTYNQPSPMPASFNPAPPPRPVQPTFTSGFAPYYDYYNPSMQNAFYHQLIASFTPQPPPTTTTPPPMYQYNDWWLWQYLAAEHGITTPSPNAEPPEPPDHPTTVNPLMAAFGPGGFMDYWQFPFGKKRKKRAVRANLPHHCTCVQNSEIDNEFVVQKNYVCKGRGLTCACAVVK